MDTIVSDVINVSISCGRPSPRLESSTVLAVQKSYVLQVRVGNIILNASILSDGAHADAVCTITPQILDIDIGGVGLRRETIVTNIDPGIQYGQSVYIQGVKAVSVLRECLWYNQPAEVACSAQ